MISPRKFILTSGVFFGIGLAVGYMLCGQGKLPVAPPTAPTTVQAQAPKAQDTSSIDLRFSPNGGCTEAIVQEINQAKESILVQAYAFTSHNISQALVDAKNRGVKVTAILDSNFNAHDKNSDMPVLIEAGIPVYLDAQHSIAHNKIMVIDDATVITGSFNFTRAAEICNAENVLILHGRVDLAKAYTENFQAHLKHSSVSSGSR